MAREAEDIKAKTPDWVPFFIYYYKFCIVIPYSEATSLNVVLVVELFGTLTMRVVPDFLLQKNLTILK